MQHSVEDVFVIHCTCGDVITIGDTFYDTRGKRPVHRKAKSVAMAWEAYRLHWAATRIGEW